MRSRWDGVWLWWSLLIVLGSAQLGIKISKPGEPGRPVVESVVSEPVSAPIAVCCFLQLDMMTEHCLYDQLRGTHGGQTDGTGRAVGRHDTRQQGDRLLRAN